MVTAHNPPENFFEWSFNDHLKKITGTLKYSDPKKKYHFLTIQINLPIFEGKIASSSS